MIEFDNFKKIYIKMILESSIESSSIPLLDPFDMEKRKFVPVSVNAMKNGFKRMRFVYKNDDRSNLIIESPEYDCLTKLCNKIVSMKTYDIIKKDFIHLYIDNSWKYFKKISNAKKSIMVLKFDFSNDDEFYKVFQHFPYIDNLDDSKIFNSEFLSLKRNTNALGAMIQLSDLAIFIFNTKFKLENSTILHEFTHYLQDSFGVEILNHRRKKFDYDKLKFLCISDEEIEEVIEVLKDKSEIISYANEFYQYVRDAFNVLTHKKFDNFFIDFIVQKLVNSLNFKNENFVKAYDEVSNHCMTSLYVVLSCYVYDIRWEKIRKILIG